MPRTKETARKTTASRAPPAPAQVGATPGVAGFGAAGFAGFGGGGGGWSGAAAPAGLGAAGSSQQQMMCPPAPCAAPAAAGFAHATGFGGGGGGRAPTSQAGFGAFPSAHARPTAPCAPGGNPVGFVPAGYAGHPLAGQFGQAAECGQQVGWSQTKLLSNRGPPIDGHAASPVDRVKVAVATGVFPLDLTSSDLPPFALHRDKKMAASERRLFFTPRPLSTGTSLSLERSVRAACEQFLKTVIRRAVAMTKYAKRRRVSIADVEFALKSYVPALAFTEPYVRVRMYKGHTDAAIVRMVRRAAPPQGVMMKRARLLLAERASIFASALTKYIDPNNHRHSLEVATQMFSLKYTRPTPTTTPRIAGKMKAITVAASKFRPLPITVLFGVKFVKEVIEAITTVAVQFTLAGKSKKTLSLRAVASAVEFLFEPELEKELREKCSEKMECLRGPHMSKSAGAMNKHTGLTFPISKAKSLMKNEAGKSGIRICRLTAALYLAAVAEELWTRACTKACEGTPVLRRAQRLHPGRVAVGIANDPHLISACAAMGIEYMFFNLPHF